MQDYSVGLHGCCFSQHYPTCDLFCYFCFPELDRGLLQYAFGFPCVVAIRICCCDSHLSFPVFICAFGWGVLACGNTFNTGIDNTFNTGIDRLLQRGGFCAIILFNILALEIWIGGCI